MRCREEWQGRLDRISIELTKIPGVSTSFFIPDIANHVPHMQISWDSRVPLSRSRFQKCCELPSLRLSWVAAKAGLG